MTMLKLLCRTTAISGAIRAPAAALAGLLLLPGAAMGQGQLPQPQASPAATLAQTIGITQVTVSWHRPAVKGRTVWGELVPYGEVWRAGANENTTITFSSPVKVQGHDLPAGTYGLHMIPTATTWTIIFNRNSTSWGSYSYSEKEDALRVTVTPVAAPHTEWLAYDFGDLTEGGATLALRWEKLAVPVQLTVDTPQVILAYARSTYLPSLPATDWKGPNSAAAYCLRTGTNLEEALTWSERSIAIAKNTTNLSVKAGLLEALGRNAEAEPVRKEALAMATEPELNALGYQYLQGKQLAKALEIFKANVAAHPDSWNAHDSLAEASAQGGDTKSAIEHYRKALQLVKDDANKARIEETLKQLGAQ
jgi:hypothetical protein